MNCVDVDSQSQAAINTDALINKNYVLKSFQCLCAWAKFSLIICFGTNQVAIGLATKKYVHPTSARPIPSITFKSLSLSGRWDIKIYVKEASSKAFQIRNKSHILENKGICVHTYM